MSPQLATDPSPSLAKRVLKRAGVMVAVSMVLLFIAAAAGLGGNGCADNEIYSGGWGCVGPMPCPELGEGFDEDTLCYGI